METAGPTISSFHLNYKSRFGYVFDFWMPRMPTGTMTVEEAREIEANVSGFFETLLEWEAVTRKHDSAHTDKAPRAR